VRRLPFFAVVLLLALAGAALGARGDPQKRIVAADQARAKAMVLRTADLGPGFAAVPSGSDSGFYCKALDESELVVTGDVDTLFKRGIVGIGSAAQVYASRRHARTSWQQTRSAAGMKCLHSFLRYEARSIGLADVQFPAPFSFPRLAEDRFSFRVAGFVQGVPVFLDFLALIQGRAQVLLAFVSAPQPVLKPEQIRLGRIVASRMAKAMRGG
jgi:hypothetical protein